MMTFSFSCLRYCFSEKVRRMSLLFFGCGYAALWSYLGVFSGEICFYRQYSGLGYSIIIAFFRGSHIDKITLLGSEFKVPGWIVWFIVGLKCFFNSDPINP